MNRRAELNSATAMMKRALLSSFAPSTGVILDAVRGYIAVKTHPATRSIDDRSGPSSPSTSPAGQADNHPGEDGLSPLR